MAKTRTSTPSNSNYTWLSASYLRSAVASATILLEAAVAGERGAGSDQPLADLLAAQQTVTADLSRDKMQALTDRRKISGSRA